MQVITVELLHEQALALLQQLEKLNILRLVAAKKPEEKPRRQWAGSISKDTGARMHQYVTESRAEWERNI